ncbi:MAG: cytochrome P450 [Acidimicrobiia bacterium]
MTATQHSGCPVVHLDTGAERPAGEWITEYGRLREQAPVVWNEVGNFWILTDSDMIREAFQTPDVFTSDSVRPHDPDPPYHLIPSHEKGQRHVQFRQILNYAFGPAAVRRTADRAREHCIATIEAVAAQGRCDFVADVALIFPTRVFLELVDLPWTDAPMFVEWIDAIFEGFIAGRDVEAAQEAMAGVRAYYVDKIAERRAAGVGSVGDFLDHLLQSEVDGTRLSDDDVLNIYTQLSMAGLDTVKSTLAAAFLHLATHPEDQRRIVEDPTVIPTAVEETMRAFPLIMIGRKLGRDVDFHGVEMHQGEMVMLALPAAMRDPNFFDRPDEVVLDRDPNNHYSFGAGQHRCLGSHLARMELVTFLEEWHRRIPEYRLAVPVEEVRERGGQLSLRSLPLEWDVPA